MNNPKFRAWDTVKKEWVDNVYLSGDGWHFQNDIDDHNPNLEIVFFTGFHDAKKVDLYDRDLVDGGRGMISEIKWSEEKGQWYICPLKPTPDYPLCNHNDAVVKIGDRFTNPELLEQK